MKHPSTFTIEQLMTYKENSQLEVKSARGGLSNSLWESYSAFANSEGGVIILGVKENENGTFFVEGLKDPHKLMKDFWNIVNNRQKVSSNILTDSMVYSYNIDGKDIIVINVPRAERTSRPVYVGADPRIGTYRRNGEGDYHCSLEEVSLMIRDSALVTDDNKLLTEFEANIFCPDTINSYRNIFRLVRPKHLWNNEDDTMFLRRIGAIREDKDSGKFHPTVAGLLMFGYESEISSIFPHYFLDYQENRTNGINARWTDRITSQTGDWSGNVFDFLLKVIPKLQADLKVPFVFKGNVRDEDTPLHKTVREATVNMLTNADFYGRRGVVVHKGSEGFKFANPGCMRVSLKEALQDSASDPRNGVMMKMLALVEYGERAGSGLHGIYKTWESVFHCSPKLEVTTSSGIDRTTLSLVFDGHQPDIDAMRQLYNNNWEVNEGFTTYGISDYVPQNSINVPQNSINVPQNDDNVPQNDDNVPQNSINVPQNDDNVPQNSINIPQNDDNIPQNDDNVPQNSINIPQNEANIPQTKDKYLKSLILKLIKEDNNATRKKIASHLNISTKTVGRYLSKLGISWSGHPKTGHWIISDEI